MKNFAALVAATALMCGAPLAQAQQSSKSNLRILRVFSEGQSTGGFFPVEDISADCLWGLMYIDLAHAAGRGQLALLMQAKAQGARLQRVDFTKNAPGYPAGACLATGIHVE